MQVLKAARPHPDMHASTKINISLTFVKLDCDRSVYP